MPNDFDWEEVRRLARDAVQANRRTMLPKLSLRGIDAAALTAARAWLGPKRVADWDWQDATKRPKPNRYELALWHEDWLCGLAYGPATSRMVAIEYFEGDPDPTHPLKRRVTDLAIATLETQMFIAQAVEARLLGPRPALVSFYKEFGYERGGSGFLDG